VGGDILSVPRVSVCIPSYNGAALLPACLDALRAQTFRDFEVLVVDDHSTDATPAVVARYPEVRFLRLRRNRRFVGAANTGLRAARGPLLALLNNDAVPDPTWLAELVAALERHPWAGFAASRLVLYDDPGRFHSAGDYYGRDGVPNSRGVWQTDTGQYDREEEVFGACAAAALYRRAMLAALSGAPTPDALLPPVFDPALTMYCEDVDLNLRARLAGYRGVYVPTARVRHMLSATGGGALASYYCGRNFLYLLAKDLPGPVLRRNAGAILAAQVRFAAEALRHVREPAARARLRGMMAGLLTWPRLLPARRRVLGDPAARPALLAAWIGRAAAPLPEGDCDG
jgi:GT2 family glycosyltransferase